jgi:hypothetical protein
MKFPPIEEQRRLVRQWRETGHELERLRREKLRNKPYDWKDVDALLELGRLSGAPSRTATGLEEMHKYYRIYRERLEAETPAAENRK